MADAKAVFEQTKSKGAKGDGFDKLEKRLNESKVQAPSHKQMKSLLNLYKQGKIH